MLYMTRVLVYFLLFLAMILRASPVLAVDNDAVEGAIKKGKAYLYSKQKDGTWEKAATGKYTNDNTHEGGQWGGVTALCTYALLAAGESPQDAKLVKAIEFLKKADIRGTYALALRMQVWLLLPQTKEILQLARKDAETLLAMTQSEGSARGMHDYTIANKSYSHSRTQYAVLALWAAEQMAVEVPSKYWETAEAGWLDHQDPSGGWTYRKKAETEHALTPGMTAAGVATLFITQDYLHAKDAIECRGNKANPATGAINKGVEWLSKHFDKIATSTRYSRDFPFATLYAVERVGVAGGLKYFGTHDWYEKGATWLLKVQKADGSFVVGGTGSMEHIFGPVVDTAFATLFLVRGRAPVAFAKLDYSTDPKKPAQWNQRPRDVANLVRWIGLSLERDLNWQVVNLQVDATELLDSSILYLAGSQPVEISDPHVEKLRAFVEMGGMIVGHADCASPAFAASFRKLGEKLFPKYEFGELPAAHVIYNNNFKYANWKQKPTVQGLSNGSRELMLLIHSGDPARLWQVRAAKGREDSWQLMANVFLYTSDRRDLRYKGDTHIVLPNNAISTTRKVSLARLEYDGGNWNPEPGGWRRMTAILHNEHKAALEVKPVKLGSGQLGSGGFKVAHLTGTTRFKLSEGAVEELRKFTSAGGLLVLDAAGGSAEFADSADALAKTLYPDNAAALLPPEHAVYQRGGQPMAVTYRPFAQRGALAGARTGRLYGVSIDNRLAIVVSREDLSTGLVGQAVDGIIGYSPRTATDLMANLILRTVPAAAGGGDTAKPTTKESKEPTKPATKGTSKSTKKPSGDKKK